MTCGGDEIIVKHFSGKSPFHPRDQVTTQSWVPDPTPKRIHRTKVKQEENGWVEFQIPSQSEFMKPKYCAVNRQLSNCSPPITTTKNDDSHSSRTWRLRRREKGELRKKEKKGKCGLAFEWGGYFDVSLPHFPLFFPPLFFFSREKGGESSLS